MVEDNLIDKSVILSSNEYNEFRKYFNSNLNKYDDEIYSLINSTDEEETKDLKENAMNYYGKNYYKGYSMGDGFGATGFIYKIKSVNKINNTTYEIVILSTNTVSNKNYEGVLTIEKVDNYFKYSSLVFKLIK